MTITEQNIMKLQEAIKTATLDDGLSEYVEMLNIYVCIVHTAKMANIDMDGEDAVIDA